MGKDLDSHSGYFPSEIRVCVCSTMIFFNVPEFQESLMNITQLETTPNSLLE